ncbi:MAG: hypothetical protein ACPGWM_08760, partial [Flavobacteriales bacterium]
NGGFAFDSNTAGNPSASTLSFSGLSEGTYTYQVIGTDDGDPVRSNILTVTVEVTDCGNNCDPVLAIVCPADASIECGDSTDPADLGMAVPSIDDCFDGDIQLSFTDAVSTVDDCTTMITRTWTATAGDMSEMCSQIIMSSDNTAPVLEMPANLDYTFEWGVADGNLVDQFLAGQIGIDDLEELLPAYAADLNAQGFFFPTASDVCDGSVEPYYIQTVIGSDDLDCPVVARVIWEFFAEDACGNQSSGIEVVCDFLDTTAPEFTNLPDGITVACLEDVPAPIVGEATDSCADVVTVESFDSETGFPVTECTGETAVAAPGGGGSWAVFLPNLEADGLAETVAFDSDNMVFVQYNDSTAHLTGTVVNSENTDQAFEVSIWLDSRRDWATWSSLGRSFKDNLGFGAADNNYENWDYYEMVNGFSTLTGLGDYAGSTLYLTHLPASYYYGFQCGLGANDKNGNFGMSGWFEYSGFLNGQAVEGPGDVNIDKECTPINEQDCPHNDEFTYFYRAID